MSQPRLSAVLSHLHRLAGRPAPDEPSDPALVQRFLDRQDQEAFTALVRRHGPLVWRVCRRLLPRPEQAEDAFQATFLVLARKAGSIRRPAALASWLHGVAFRVANKARARREPPRADPEEPLTGPAADPCHQAAWRELGAVLEGEVARLPEGCRDAVLLCYWQGLTNDEAARQLGCPAGTVKTRLARARRLLHERLTARGVTLPAGVLALLLAQPGADATPPEALLAAAVRAAAAEGPRSGSLAAFALPGTAAGKVRLLVLVGLLLGLSLLGAGLAPRQPPGPPPPAAKAQGAIAGKPKTAEAPPRTDRHGDPLPPDAVARLGASRFRFEEEATALQFSPDGKLLVGHTGSGLLFWDVATGREVRRLAQTVLPRVYGMDFSPDGRTLAIACTEGTRDGVPSLLFWDVAAGKKLRTFPLGDADPKAGAFGVRFSPDGKRLAVLTRFHAVRVLDLASGKSIASFGDHRAAIYGLTFSPSGKAVVLATLNPGVQMWEVASSKLVRGLDHPRKGFVNAVAFSPDGKLLASGSWDCILLSDPATGKELGRCEAKMESVNGLAFTPDGKTLISGSQDGKVRLWDVASGKVRLTLDGRMWPGRCLALTRDGKKVAIGTCGRTVRLWELPSGKELFTEFEGHDSRVNCLLFSPDGTSLFSGGDSQQIRQWDTATWTQVRLLPGSAWNLSLTRDGTRLASVPYRGAVRLWDTAAGKEARLFKVPDTDEVRHGLITADGKRLLTADRVPSKERDGRRTYRLHLWDLGTGKPLREVVLPKTRVDNLAMTADGRTAVAGLLEGVHVYNMEAGKRRFGIGEPRLRLDVLALSPDGGLLVTGGLERTVRLWEVASGKEVLALRGHRRGIEAVAFSADGRLAASGDRYHAYPGEDRGPRTVRLWDVASGKEVGRFTGHGADVAALAFSPDGAHLAGALTDATILVWAVPASARAPRGAPRPLGPGEPEKLWADLAGDAAAAHRAGWALSAAPRQAVPLLRERLRPVAAADEKQVRKWLGDLESKQFAARQGAVRALERLHGQGERAVLDAMKGESSLEARRRLEGVLTALQGAPPAEVLRVLRAVRVLERIGSGEARAVLRRLAGGAPAAWETREAQAALDRLRGARGGKGPP
jgi:RNA polymerase sigma factor (sigma-70 family)